MLFRKHSLLVSVLVATAVLAISSAQGGEISIVDFSGDTTCGIDGLLKTYTHAVNMSTTTTDKPTINNLAFDCITSDNSAANGKVIHLGSTFTYETDNPGAGGPQGYLAVTSGATGNIGMDDTNQMYKLLSACMYPHGHHVYTKITLSGLVDETTYDLRIYYRPWTLSGTRNVNFDFNVGGDASIEDTRLVNEDASSKAQASYLSYEYKADASGVLTVQLNIDSSNWAGWHMYGLTNEVVSVPEPSTLALLACGLIGLLAYAWRKRK